MFKTKSLSPKKNDYFASPSTKKKFVVGKRIKRLNELKDIADYEDDPYAGYDSQNDFDEEDLVRLEAQVRASKGGRSAPSTPKKNRSLTRMKKVLGDKTRQLRRGSSRERGSPRRKTSISDDPHELGTAKHVFSPTNNRRGRLTSMRKIKSDDGLFEMRKSLITEENKDARFNAVDSSYNQVIDKYKQLGSGKKKIIDQDESKERRKNIAESLLGFLDDMYESQF